MDLKKRMGFLWLLLGGCFLWNPIVGVSDILPDVFGYLFLCVGIAKLADLNDDLAESQKAFRTMLWVGFGQVAAWWLVAKFLKTAEMDMNQYEEPVWVLVFAFVFLVLELYVMLSGWKLFFNGLSQMAERHGDCEILRERNGRSWCEKMITHTRVFVVCKTILMLLPEASVLTAFEKEEETSRFLFNWFPYVSAFRVIAAAIGLVIGLIWLIEYVCFMRSAMGDESWQASLRERYREEILPNTGLLLNRRVQSAFRFFQVGILFCVNVTVLYRELLPDWCGVLLFFCGGILLGDLLKQIKPCLISGGALLVTGVCRTVLNRAYLEDDYIPLKALYSHDAYQRYLPIRILSWAEAVFVFVFILCVMYALTELMKQYTAVDYGSDTSLSQRATQRMHREMRRFSIPVLAGWGLSSICKILEVELQPRLGWFWMVQFAVSLTSAFLFFAYLSKLAEMIGERFPNQKGRINF